MGISKGVPYKYLHLFDFYFYEYHWEGLAYSKNICANDTMVYSAIPSPSQAVDELQTAL